MGKRIRKRVLKVCFMLSISTFRKAGGLELRKLLPYFRNLQAHTVRTEMEYRHHLQGIHRPHLSHPHRITTTVHTLNHPHPRQPRNCSPITRARVNPYQTSPRRPPIMTRSGTPPPATRPIKFHRPPQGQYSQPAHWSLLRLRLHPGLLQHPIPRRLYPLLYSRILSDVGIGHLGR